MDRDEMFEAITAQRHRLIGTLETLDDEQWHVPSWCSGWDVVHVVGTRQQCFIPNRHAQTAALGSQLIGPPIENGPQHQILGAGRTAEIGDRRLAV